jgi:hypothetical protein
MNTLGLTQHDGTPCTPSDDMPLWRSVHELVRLCTQPPHCDNTSMLAMSCPVARTSSPQAAASIRRWNTACCSMLYTCWHEVSSSHV